ncbi:hypothetical protein ACIPX0_45795 [Streptomyces sp. NPDC090075]|uniref:hypothetical protein n=1 Tax=Streptomyces sp. NPDC090075 TaxID=3365937 RepID=UPI0038292ABD
MTSSAKYDDFFISHVELMHRPGELDLAIKFFETLGCVTEDLTEDFNAPWTITGIFSGKADRGDVLNNVLYLSELREPDAQLDRHLSALAAGEDELGEALRAYDQIRRRPGDVTHFGLRYETFEELAEVTDRLTNELPEELKGRVTVIPTGPLPLPRTGREVNQAFVHTDVIGGGLFPFGQLIELQGQRPLPQG